MKTSLKHKIYLLLDPDKGGTVWDRLVNVLIVSLIILNTLAVLTETVESIYDRYTYAFRAFEIFSVFIFTVEYILRVWSITEKEEFSDPVKGRIKYMLTTGALIDLFAVAPFYLPAAMFFDLRFLRIFRLLRFIRFFKLGRYLKASKLLRRVFHSKKEELVLSLVITFFLIIASASLMYFVEHDTQPEKFSSIPETMWWSVGTLTTVGYSNIYPVTVTGRILASIISILGIGMFALPAGILASGFSDEFKQLRKKKFCPHCGHEFE